MPTSRPAKATRRKEWSWLWVAVVGMLGGLATAWIHLFFAPIRPGSSVNPVAIYLAYALLGPLYVRLLFTSDRHRKGFFYDLTEDDGNVVVKDASASLPSQFRYRAHLTRQASFFSLMFLFAFCAVVIFGVFAVESDIRQANVNGRYGEITENRWELRKIASALKTQALPPEELERALSKIDKANAAIVDASSEPDKQRSFYSYLIGRLALTILLATTLRFLVGLYRYEVRLASSYDAKADVLLLLQQGLSFEQAQQISAIEGVTLETSLVGKPAFSIALWDRGKGGRADSPKAESLSTTRDEA